MGRDGTERMVEMSEICRITVYFSDEENPWEYPLALNGRTIERVTFGGVEVAPVRECSVVNDIEPRDTTMRVIGSCSECGHILCGSDWCCAHCGARVRGGGDD